MASLDDLARRLDIDLAGEQAQLFSGQAIRSAHERAPFQRGLVSVDPARSALVLGVNANAIDSVTRFLVDGYGTDAVCHVIDPDVDDEPATSVSLGQLHLFLTSDRLAESDLAIWVAAADPYRAGRSPETLVRIVARLRAPGGCPWDREQTSQSLRDDIAGEAYEVMDAIDRGDDRNLTEELGDVLMAVALQAQIAEDEGRFTLADVYEAVNAKLVRRHPHVFGDVRVSDTGEIVANWNRIKAEEKAAAGQQAANPQDPLARYPESMPALSLVARIVARGEWPNDVFIDPFGPADEAEEAADWYARRLAARADPEAELRAAVRRLLTADHSLRFINSAGERTEEWIGEHDDDGSPADSDRP